MKQIELSDRVIIPIEIPYYALPLTCRIDGKELTYNTYREDVPMEGVMLPSEGFKLIGQVKDIVQSEEKCKEVVEESWLLSTSTTCTYKDYMQYVEDAFEHYSSPIDSFRSLTAAYNLKETDLLIVKIK